MKIAIATPIQNRMVGSAHHENMWALASDPAFSLLPDKLSVDDDLVRARSRCVHYFLNDTSADALLFVDSDVVVDRVALREMIAANVECIGCTYPKKSIDAWGLSRDFALRPGENRAIVNGRASVESIGMGCMLLRRSLLQSLTDDCPPEMRDESDGYPMAMLFMLRWHTRQGRRFLLPEDYSFCQLVKAYTDVWLYCGPGAPLAHEGHHVFRGRREDVHGSPMPIQAPPPLVYEGDDGKPHTWGDD